MYIYIPNIWGMMFFALVTRFFCDGDWYRGFSRELQGFFCAVGLLRTRVPSRVRRIHSLEEVVQGPSCCACYACCGFVVGENWVVLFVGLVSFRVERPEDLVGIGMGHS